VLSVGYSQYLYLVPVVATVDLDAGDSYLVEEGAPLRAPFLFVGLFNCVSPLLPPAPQTFFLSPTESATVRDERKNRGGPQEGLAVASAEHVLREAAGRCVKNICK